MRVIVLTVSPPACGGARSASPLVRSAGHGSMDAESGSMDIPRAAGRPDAEKKPESLHERSRGKMVKQLWPMAPLPDTVTIMMGANRTEYKLDVRAVANKHGLPAILAPVLFTEATEEQKEGFGLCTIETVLTLSSHKMFYLTGSCAPPSKEDIKTKMNDQDE